MLDKNDVRNLILKHERRLQILKEQRASFGLHTPAHILIELEDTQAEIERLKAELTVSKDSIEKPQNASPELAESSNVIKGKKFENPLLILTLAFPVSVLYLARIALTSTSLTWAAIGYTTMGLSFGLLQSLLKVRHPYLVAFLSTALIPLLAYMVFAATSILALIIGGISDSSMMEYTSDYTGGIINLSPTSYVGPLGFVGIFLFIVVLSILIIPFGIIGVSGRFLGDKLLPYLDELISSTGIGNTNEIQKVKISVYITGILAVISALSSILIAVLK